MKYIRIPFLTSLFSMGCIAIIPLVAVIAVATVAFIIGIWWASSSEIYEFAMSTFYIIVSILVAMLPVGLMGLISGFIISLITFGLFHEEFNNAIYYIVTGGVTAILWWFVPSLIHGRVMIDHERMLWIGGGVIVSLIVANITINNMKKNQQSKDRDALEEENWHLRQELFYLKNQRQNNISQYKQKNGQPAPAKPWKKAEAIVLAIGIIIVGLLMLVSSLVQSIP
jgi:hypothetical protein